MNVHLERARLLFGQSRLDHAENELKSCLAEEPNHPEAHALLAICLARREEYAGATEEARQAIQCEPDFAYAHYAMGVVLTNRNRLDEAKSAAEEAIRLDPSDADYLGLLAQIELNRRDWPSALAAAEHGLQLDAEHVACTNLRAMALVRLGRQSEAKTTIDATLAKEPENAWSHATQGWTLLEQSQPYKAMEHFREALRLDPELEWARMGIVEAMKARNFFYRMMLRYFLWMQKLSAKAQWAVILLLLFGQRMMGQIARDSPELAPYATAVWIALIVFALSSWIADPLFNLFLRMSRFGRLALSREQIVESNWVGGLLAVALGALGVWFFTRGNTADIALIVALYAGLMVLPVCGVFNCPSGWPRIGMTLYTMALGGVALTVFYKLHQSVQARVLDPNLGTLSTTFFLGIFLSQFAANILGAVRIRR